MTRRNSLRQKQPHKKNQQHEEERREERWRKEQFEIAQLRRQLCQRRALLELEVLHLRELAQHKHHAELLGHLLPGIEGADRLTSPDVRHRCLPNILGAFGFVIFSGFLDLFGSLVRPALDIGSDQDVNFAIDVWLSI